MNGDDGNQNYDRGIASNAAKWSSEFQLNYRNFGGFVRAFAFYDYENEDKDRERTALSGDALRPCRQPRRDPRRLRLVQVPPRQAGRRESAPASQVINWGESTFIQGGINAINPVDVSALRVPGAELRDALLPVGAALFSMKPSENTSFEVYYQYDWEETQIDPVGSYFSTTDLAGGGAEKVMLGFGSAPDTIPVGARIPGNPVGAVVPRGATREADESNQYGAAFRWFVPALGGTDFGFYYMKYNSRLPVIMAHTGTAAGLLVNGNYAGSAYYFLEYPEDIDLYGVSFNTQLGAGVALQGEISHRLDVPLQVDDVELLFAALSPLRLLPAIPQLAPVRGLGALLAANDQLGAYGFNEEIQGYRRFDTTQVQMTGTKVFSQVLGADQFTLVGEAGWSTVHDMPDASELRLEGPGTYTSGNPIFTAARCPAGDRVVLGVPDRQRLGLRPRRPPRLQQRLRRGELRAALLLGAGRQRHLARARRQLPRRPRGAHRRARLQLPDQLGVGRLLHLVLRCRSLQPDQRPRLPRGQHQVLVLRRRRHAKPLIESFHRPLSAC